MSEPDRFTPSSALPTTSDRYAAASSPANVNPVKPDPYASRMAVDREFPSQSSHAHGGSSDRFRGHSDAGHNRSRRSRSRSPPRRYSSDRGSRPSDARDYRRRSRSRSPPRRSRNYRSRSRSRSRDRDRDRGHGRDRNLDHRHDRGYDREHGREGGRGRSRSPSPMTRGGEGPGYRVWLNNDKPDPNWFFDPAPDASLPSAPIVPAASSVASTSSASVSAESTTAPSSSESPAAIAAAVKEAAAARASDASIRSLCLTLARDHASQLAEQYQVFLSSLHPRTEERDLAELFSLLNVPFAVKLSRDQRSNRSRGIGFAAFPATDIIETVLKLNGQLVFGLPISIERTSSLPVAKPATVVSASTTGIDSAAASGTNGSSGASASGGKDKAWLTIRGLPPMFSPADVRRRLLPSAHLRALACDALTARTEPGAATAWVCFETDIGKPAVVGDGVAAVESAAAVASAAARIIKEAVEEGKVDGIAAGTVVDVKIGKIFPDSVLKRLHFDPLVKPAAPIAVWPHPKLFAAAEDEAKASPAA